MEKEKKFTTRQFVEMALLTGIILLLAFTPLGYIRTFGLEITLIVVPVTVGAVTLGPPAGAALGAVFGITSFLQCFGMSPFGTVLMGINPAATFIVCVVSRVLMGWLTGVLYQAFKKAAFLSKAALVLANLIGPLLNTEYVLPVFLWGLWFFSFIRRIIFKALRNLWEHPA